MNVLYLCPYTVAYWSSQKGFLFSLYHRAGLTDFYGLNFSHTAAVSDLNLTFVWEKGSKKIHNRFVYMTFKQQVRLLSLSWKLFLWANQAWLCFVSKFCVQTLGVLLQGYSVMLLMICFHKSFQSDVCELRILFFFFFF